MLSAGQTTVQWPEKTFLIDWRIAEGLLQIELAKDAPNVRHPRVLVPAYPRYYCFCLYFCGEILLECDIL